MAGDPNDERPGESPTHVIGSDLYALSVGELTERIEILRAEIRRLEEARDRKSAHLTAAEQVFGSR